MHAFDRQTDGQTEFPSLYRDCIPCSAVKTRPTVLSWPNLQSVLNVAARLVYTTVGSTTTFLHCLAICSGCEFQTASSFVWPFLSMDLCSVNTEVHVSSSVVVITPCPRTAETCTGWRVATVGDDFGRHQSKSWCFPPNKIKDWR